ncbi:MAG: RNA-guided endonuclease TnpB family protein [Caldilineaceae bacterium]
MIRKAFKFRIYPNSEQQNKLAVQFGCSRFVYNHYRAAREGYYQDTGTGLTYNDCAVDLTERLKVEHPWLKETDSQVIQQVLMDLDKAYMNFFEGRADYPNFKRKFAKQSIRYPQRFKLDGSKLYLPKVGWVKIVLHRKLEGNAKNCTVSKTKTGKYFASIQCEIEKDIQPTTNRQAVGIDLGLKNFAILSSQDETTKIEPPKHLCKAENLLKIRQRRVSRKVKGGNSRNKARLVVAATHEKITNRRKDFHHQLSRRIVNRFGSIGLETLNVKGMIQNHSLAKSIADAGWSQFVTFTEYKAAWAGVEVVKQDRWFASSKTCHDCGYIHRNLKLSDRTWLCPECGVIHDRDENAANNLMPTTLGARESNAVGDMSSVVRHSAPEKFQATVLEAQQL